ncbi:MAG TPA: PspC domain-containing protein [Candidatus Bathyarchaeia archaeon]|nr:PspC domain-containing protein [Candidatus Bathyarchaeia archaeon]
MSIIENEDNEKEEEELNQSFKNEKTKSDSRILFRSREDYMLAGVLGGLAAFWGMDSSLLRIIFLLLSIILVGLPVITYLILSKVIPYEPE